MTRLMNESMNDEAVYRTAPATPGLLTSLLHRLQAETLHDATPPLSKLSRSPKS